MELTIFKPSLITFPAKKYQKYFVGGTSWNDFSMYISGRVFDCFHGNEKHTHSTRRWIRIVFKLCQVKLCFHLWTTWSSLTTSRQECFFFKKVSVEMPEDQLKVCESVVDVRDSPKNGVFGISQFGTHPASKRNLLFSKVHAVLPGSCQSTKIPIWTGNVLEAKQSLSWLLDIYIVLITSVFTVLHNDRQRQRRTGTLFFVVNFKWTCCIYF